MSFSDQEIEEFKVEAFELLEVAEKSLLALDQGAEFKPAFDAIFRSFHNLKGASGMMELTQLNHAAGELLNITYASARTKINEAGHGFELAIPSVIEGKQFKICHGALKKATRVSCQSEFGRFHFELSLRPNP